MTLGPSQNPTSMYQIVGQGKEKLRMGQAYKGLHIKWGWGSGTTHLQLPYFAAAQKHNLSIKQQLTRAFAFNI